MAGAGFSMAQLKIDRSFVLEAAWRALVFIVALVILIVVTTRWNGWTGRTGWQSTDDAYLQADITPIAAKVSGYVRAVPVSDFQRVAAGQPVAEIVDDDYRTAVAQAEAGVAAAKAQVQALTAQESLQVSNVQAAAAQVASVAANLEQSGRDVARQRRLVTGGSSSAEAGERLETTRQQLSAQLARPTPRAASAG